MGVLNAHFTKYPGNHAGRSWCDESFGHADVSTPEECAQLCLDSDGCNGFNSPNGDNQCQMCRHLGGHDDKRPDVTCDAYILHSLPSDTPGKACEDISAQDCDSYLDCINGPEGCTLSKAMCDSGLSLEFCRGYDSCSYDMEYNSCMYSDPCAHKNMNECTNGCYWSSYTNSCKKDQGCLNLSNEDCNNHPDCSWMNEQCTFVSDDYGEQQCGDISIMSDCINGCYWDVSANLCKKDQGCAGLADEECGNHPDCSWVNGQCEFQSGGHCGEYFTEISCDADSECYYDWQTWQCQRLSDQTCDVLTEQQCLNHPNCYFDGMQHDCLVSVNGNGMDCSSYSSKSDCDPISECLWDDMDNRCEQNDCFGLLQNECDKRDYCYFDGGGVNSCELARDQACSDLNSAQCNYHQSCYINNGVCTHDEHSGSHGATNHCELYQSEWECNQDSECYAENGLCYPHGDQEDPGCSNFGTDATGCARQKDCYIRSGDGKCDYETNPECEHRSASTSDCDDYHSRCMLNHETNKCDYKDPGCRSISVSDCGYHEGCYIDSFEKCEYEHPEDAHSDHQQDPGCLDFGTSPDCAEQKYCYIRSDNDKCDYEPDPACESRPASKNDCDDYNSLCELDEVQVKCGYKDPGCFSKDPMACGYYIGCYIDSLGNCVYEHPNNDENDGLPTSNPTTRGPTSSSPTDSPTTSPTDSPSASPTDPPTTSPTKNPTKSPSVSPTASPTTSPTVSPTTSPSKSPSTSPTESPTTRPTAAPTTSPTQLPSANPTDSPTTHHPTVSPTKSPTQLPSAHPTDSPTKNPTDLPTLDPTTQEPTSEPSKSPTSSPTTLEPTISPTKKPSVTPIFIVQVVHEQQQQEEEDPCKNSIRDNEETDIDCGGPSCGPCLVGSTCTLDSDCLLASCLGGTCAKRTKEEKVALTQNLIKDLQCKKNPDSSICKKDESSEEGNPTEERISNVVPAGITFPEAEFDEIVHNSEAFITEFRISVTEPLGLPPSACVVIDVYSGSVVVDYALIGVEPTKETATFLETSTEFAKTVADDLAVKLKDKGIAPLGAAQATECKTIKQEEFNPVPLLIVGSGFLVVASLSLYVVRSYHKSARLAKVMSKQASKIETEIEDIENEKTMKKEQVKRMTEINAQVSEAELDAVRKVFDGMERNVREVFFEDLKLETLLGQGSFGSVYKALWKNEALQGKDGDGKFVAAKVMNRHHIKGDVLLNVRGEVLLLAALKPHPNIVEFFGASWNMPPNIAIVMEFADGGDLFTLLHNQEAIKLSWRENLLEIAIGVARGIAHMHAHTYIHRDIKPGNILLTEALVPKIGDLGEARVVDDAKHMTQVGTPLYCAPEILNDDFYDEKVDVYSFGVTLNQMDTREAPFTDCATRESTFNAIKVVGADLRPALCNKSTSASKTKDSTPGLRALIMQCWSGSPSDRPTAAEVIDALEDISEDLLSEDVRLPSSVDDDVLPVP